jgi:hybrid polyketide synthase / nonribosomal peptide synthetase ACE1
VIRRRPAKTAIKDGRGKIATYGDLERRINCIAATLLNAGVRQGSKVSVFQEPTSDWICSLLAIMYIGGVYIPLDRGIPSSRLAIIVKESEPSAILIDSETATDVASISIHQSIVIDVSQLALDDGVMVSPSATLDSPAAILYTSGSTGTPKGIVLRHENLRNEVEFSSRIYGFGEEIVLQQSALCFDMSLTQIFSAIAYGGTLIMIPRSLRGDSLTLTQLIVEEKISFTGATPSEYMSWFLYGNAQQLHTSNWKIAIAGGEQVPETLLKYPKNPGKLDLRLFNAYGPTEGQIKCKYPTWLRVH